MKGNTWYVKVPRNEETRTQNLNDTRQLTFLGGASAAGVTIPGQVVVKGKTAASLPQVREHSPPAPSPTGALHLSSQAASVLALGLIINLTLAYLR